MGEFFLEFFVEIIGEMFMESAVGLSKSKYIPKWLRIIAITISVGVFGGILLLIVWEIFDSYTLLLVLGIIIAAIWLFLVIRALTIRTQKYQYVSLDSDCTFKGRRTYTEIIGKLKPKNITERLGEKKEIKVCFLKTGEFPEKEQFAVIEERERQLLNDIYHMTDDELNCLINRARNELMIKLGADNNSYSNGKSIILYKVSYIKSPNEYMICYYLKDEKTGKKIKIKDKTTV